jgi:hypothetical protein
MFCQLDEHAAGRAGVDERDSLALGTNAGGLVDQPNPNGPAAGEYAVEVIDSKTDVMESWTALLEEPGDRPVGSARLEQFNQGVTGRYRGDGGSVGVIERHFRETEHVTVERERVGEAANGNADMSDTGS